MNPETEREKLSRRNPPGKYSMSPETKEALREIKKDVDRKFEEIKSEIKEIENKHEKDMVIIEAKVESKVSFKIFTWVLAILMMVVIGIQGVVWFQVKETNSTTNKVDKNIDLINYRLDQFEAVK